MTDIFPGIGTALRILLDDSVGGREGVGGQQEVELQRNEAIALVNSLLKFAESIEIFIKMGARESERVWRNVCVFMFSLSVAISLVLFTLLKMVLWACSLISSNKNDKKRR